MTTSTKRKLKTVGNVTTVTLILGAVYPIIFTTPHQLDAPLWHSILNGFFNGLFVGIAVSLGEVYLFQTRLGRLRFSYFLVLQTLFYLAAIYVSTFGVISLHMVVFHGFSLADSFQSSGFKNFYRDEFIKVNVYALVVLFLLNFIRRVNRMLGQNALWEFLSGKYHKPVEEQRVFMFLDLTASTAMAEKLGHKDFHELLDDFFYDITPAILDNRGEVYQYVGDEVVVTWPKDRGLQDANCLKCYFRILAAIAAMSEKYKRKYGLVPTFKAGCHYGTVTAGLSGDIKRSLVFHGDTVNTAARIRSECTSAHRPLLLSGVLLRRLEGTAGLTPESMGKIKLRGRGEEIELFAIKEAD